ncbi:hypothetical protein [Bradyrhizobium sp. 15]|uniref:hypothetical protein n=1 Tax=Bradyrhizobium sp. 15 TaxID=2782633 RepID=UPI001FF8AD5C|nr:hypothetical protein [Bradyrhizobium sp. 15]
MTTHVNVHHVTATGKVAEDLGEDDDRLWDVANEMDIKEDVFGSMASEKMASCTATTTAPKTSSSGSNSTKETRGCSSGKPAAGRAGSDQISKKARYLQKSPNSEPFARSLSVHLLYFCVAGPHSPARG